MMQSSSEHGSMKFWRNELYSDATYAVYLKKVRYYQPDDQNQLKVDGGKVAHLEWETVSVRLIKSATLDRLVRHIGLHSSEMDTAFIAVFLATYRSFTTPIELSDRIIRRYDELDSLKFQENDHNVSTEDQKSAFRITLLTWADSYVHDFQQPPHYTALRNLIQFCSKYTPDTRQLLLKFQSLLATLTDHSCHYKLSKLSIADPSNYSSCNGHACLLFENIDEERFALQLTRMDAELFLNVIPHQCLGSIWSNRKDDNTISVAATVDQFNAVSYCVISTVLCPEVTPAVRAKYISKWIDIAQILRILKNFSSLKATIAGLQSTPVYRLQHAWSLISRDKLKTFEELARIFSDDNNRLNQRQVLIKEGTAKRVEATKFNTQLSKYFHKHVDDRTTNYGTVPYLGTFLTDLMYLHVGIPTTTENDCINFDKCRKEFEILVQIKLLQGACKAYKIDSDIEFEQWFDSVIVLEDIQAYELSCRIEPAVKLAGNHGSCSSRSSKGSLDRQRPASYTSNVPDSIASTSSESSLQCTPETNSLHSSSSNWFSELQSNSVCSTKLSEELTSKTNCSELNSVTNNEMTIQKHGPAGNTSDLQVIRVSFYGGRCSSQSKQVGVNLYKSIAVKNSDKTEQVIAKAMDKHDLEGSTFDYVLVQVIDNSNEIVIPPNTNVFYAIQSDGEMKFVLRLRA